MSRINSILTFALACLVMGQFLKSDKHENTDKGPVILWTYEQWWECEKLKLPLI